MVATEQRYAVATEYDVPAAMRDGTVLRANIHRPQAVRPFPVLVMRTPYDKNREQTIALAEAVAACGYITVVQDIRGRYASDGEFDPFISPTHGNVCIEDGYDTVEWAAALPGATGAVGTFGVSYDAWTQWKLAPTRPPHLKAMFVAGANADTRTTWPGIFARDRQLQWSMCTLAPDTRRRLGLPGYQTVAAARAAWDNVERGKWLWFEPLSEIPAEALGGLAKDWRYWLSHHHCDWHHLEDGCDGIDVPIYHVTSWYDRLWGTIDLYKAMLERGRTQRTRQNQKLLLGPWSHGFDFGRRVGIMDFGPDAEVSCARMMARWFDYWLKGGDSGIMDEPPIRLFTMGANAWRYENEWPLARTQYTDYYLHSAGGANTARGDGTLSTEPPAAEPPDTFAYDPRDPLMSIYLPSAQAGPGDVRAQDHRRDLLVYQTAPLEQDLEVTGPVVLKLHTASSALDTDWAARLVDVHPDGLAVNLSYGIVRARYRESWENPVLLIPGKIYEYTITLGPTSNLFQRGHRIRLDVSSSDFPNYDRNHNTGLDYWDDRTFITAHQAVYHHAAHASRLILPIIPSG